MTLMDELVQGIRCVMKARNLTQAEVARLAKIPAPSLYKILSGRRTPSIPILEKIATGLECSLHDFLAHPSAPKINFTEKELYQIFIKALADWERADTNIAIPLGIRNELFSTVQEFGGWEFLLDYLKEEIEIRKEANNDYRKLVDSFSEEIAAKQAALTKQTQIVTNLISKASKGSS